MLLYSEVVIGIDKCCRLMFLDFILLCYIVLIIGIVCFMQSTYPCCTCNHSTTLFIFSMHFDIHVIIIVTTIVTFLNLLLYTILNRVFNDHTHIYVQRTIILIDIRNLCSLIMT